MYTSYDYAFIVYYGNFYFPAQLDEACTIRNDTGQPVTCIPLSLLRLVEHSILISPGTIRRVWAGTM